MGRDQQEPLLLSSNRSFNTVESQFSFPLAPWQRRDVILFLAESIGWALFSVTWAFLFVLPLCGLMFHCECIWKWKTCTKPDICPFCGGGTFELSLSLIPQWGVVPIMVAAALLMRLKKPNMYLIRFIVVIVTFFVCVILASVIFELASREHHFM